jgi:hypothetical protein
LACHPKEGAYIKDIWEQDAEEEVNRTMKKLRSEVLRNFYSSTNIVRVIKSKMVKREGQVARIGSEKCIQNFSRKTEGRGHLGEQGVDGIMI